VFLKGFFEKGFKIREGSVLIQIGSVSIRKVFLKGVFERSSFERRHGGGSWAA
jgi:hypothetical protein